MKVLHTADWHLGQRLAGHERMQEHALFLRWLLDTLQRQEIDLLLVAGDIFDSAHPPQAAMQLYYDFLHDLAALPRCQAIFVGGNHDSPAHLNAPSSLLRRFRIHVFGSPSTDRQQDILRINPADGLLDPVCVCAVPYLRDRDVLQIVVGEATGQRDERLREGIYQLYGDVRTRAQRHRDLQIPIIATGHLTLQGAGGKPLPEGEEETQIGTLGALDHSRFPQDFDYIALGHLHHPHAVGDCSWIRYAGSPFPMSFSESEQEKSVAVLHFRDGKLRESELLTIPPFRRLHRFAGTLKDLQRWAQTTLPTESEALTPWLEVHLTDEAERHQPEKVIDTLHQHSVEVLKILCRQPEPASKIWQNTDTERSLQEFRPEEVFAERCRAAGLDPDDDESLSLKETFAELLSLHEAQALELVSPKDSTSTSN